MNTMIIDEKDNVMVAIEAITKGEKAVCQINGKEISVVAVADVPIYHKIAVRDMKKGEPVVKYGEHIGIAGCDIKAGEYVHVHNVESHREEL